MKTNTAVATNRTALKKNSIAGTIVVEPKNEPFFFNDLFAFARAQEPKSAGTLKFPLQNFIDEDFLICSPMNYIGGKFKLLPQILTKFPAKIGTFVDLFCGGCNVGINVPAKKIIFNDNLTFLIDLYRAFQAKSENEIVRDIEVCIREFDLSLTNESGYLALRERYNRERNPLDLFVLVAFSFNHQIRFNSSHIFNMPFGRERSCYNARIAKNLREFLSAIHRGNAIFEANNFENFDFSQLTRGDFVYCDPPYLISTGTYNDGKRGFTGWSEREERKLLEILDDLNARGIAFALSNVLVHKGKENLILRDWLHGNADYHAAHLTCNYANSNYQTLDRSKTASDEVLITNYETNL